MASSIDGGVEEAAEEMESIQVGQTKTLTIPEIFDLYKLNESILKTMGTGIIPPILHNLFQKIIFGGGFAAVDPDELVAAFKEWSLAAVVDANGGDKRGILRYDPEVGLINEALPTQDSTPEFLLREADRRGATRIRKAEIE